MADSTTPDYAEIVRVITEPTRYKLLRLLMQHNYCVRAAARRLGISEPAVSQHINALKRLDLVHGVKRGYQMHYQLNKQLICEALAGLLDEFSSYDDDPTHQRMCKCEFAEECKRCAPSDKDGAAEQ